MNDLPDIVLQTFSDDLAWAQRGEPEDAMGRAQRVLGGGGLSYAIEHAGDITNRGWKDFHLLNGGTLSCHYVQNKTGDVLRTLRPLYRFIPQHFENMRGNAAYHGHSYSEHRDAVTAALLEYAEAHRALPVFNRMQLAAREAAVSLGVQDFKRAQAYLEILETNVTDCDHWYGVATQYQPGPDGRPVPITPRALASSRS
jgi:hypothetical protein